MIMRVSKSLIRKARERGLELATVEKKPLHKAERNESRQGVRRVAVTLPTSPWKDDGKPTTR
jgi:hypothetical protein